eukprot:gnl/MRDRNA2_/MRDRNA2_108529_c0_seq1.p1 gnl/MRDRNA2_/MRDRNA2_108529_c0~~gnl/MRDRNA2_/MRDRNA2_108529_c0_seq1.p1  ORF type:complete len:641 (-),score=136.76 gnl/MRDRNA2_/MRDRNA2_108529_c0_seq1:28-1950(-)
MPVELEFVIETDAQSADEVAAQLRADGAARLKELLERPLLRVQVGPNDPPLPPPSQLGGPSLGPSGGYAGVGAAAQQPGEADAAAFAINAQDLLREEEKFISWQQGRSRSGSPRRVESPRPKRKPLELLNHPTAPVGPSFPSYWDQKKGGRIRERRMQEDMARMAAEDVPPEPFKATPVPTSVSVPRFHALQAAGEAKRAASSYTRRRPQSARGANEAGPKIKPPEFHAKSVPWMVSAPLYDQMLLQQQVQRSERMNARSRQMIRASSLPPRLETMRSQIVGDQQGGSRVYRSHTPVPAHRLAKDAPPKVSSMNRPLKAEQPQHTSRPDSGVAAAENISRDVAASQLTGQTKSVAWGGSSLHGTAYGLSHYNRETVLPQRRADSEDPHERHKSQYKTTVVPNFGALHEKEKQRLERRKYQNRFVTQPAPFVFSAPSRVRARQAPPPTDPSSDWRWSRPTRARSSGAGPGGRDKPRFSVPSLEQPPTAVPPRTTEKTVAWQRQTAQMQRDRREREEQHRQELEHAQRPSGDPAMIQRVRGFLGKEESLEEKIAQKRFDRDQNLRNRMKEKQEELQGIKERVARRPLLMERTDSLVRARQRALLRVRQTLGEAGVKDLEGAGFDDADMGLLEDPNISGEDSI